ncbi:MAG: PRD domain-containing protein [Bacillus sp. (in: Bacteria)]|nr:PRD domain-containing protein [Bacillus sp. (in: firmicutes)]
MILTELKERLDILLTSDVISTKAADVALEAFIHLQSSLKKKDIDQAEMLFTHLPMALSRIEKNETVEAPHPDMLTEVRNSPHSPQASIEIANVQKLWKQSLPQEELDYLLIHYATILHINEGGNES